ncbi:MAG: ComEC/Rec2 family competence protein [Nostocoides sp.]
MPRRLTSDAPGLLTGGDLPAPDVEPEPDHPVVDVRLIGPALVAWSLAAATLGLSPGTRGTLAAVAALAGAATLVTGWLVSLRGGRSPVGIIAPLISLLPSFALAGVMVAVLLGSSAVQGQNRGGCGVIDLARQGSVVRVTGQVSTDPRPIAPKPGSIRGDPMWLLTVNAAVIDHRGASCATSAPVLVRGDRRWAGLRWHEHVEVLGRLAPAPPADAVVAMLSPMEGPRVVAAADPLARVAERARAGLRSAVRPLPADAAGLLPGLVLGDTSTTPPELTAAMKTTGMTHLSAVSGSNVAIVLGMVLGLARWVGLRRRWRPVVGMLAVAGFVILARPDPSVLRAAVMGCIGLFGIAWGRRSAGMPVLAATVFGLLAWDPWLARSFGFTLSVLATLGLLIFARPWSAAIAGPLPGWMSPVGPAVAIPTAAYVTTAPVVVLLQGQVSVVSVAANAVAAPLVAPATIAGVAAALLGVVSPVAAQIPAWIGGVPALAIAADARRFAGLPWAVVPWPGGAMGVALLTCVLILVLVTGRWWARSLAAHPVIAGVTVVLLLAAVIPTRILTWPPPHWQIVACDVGQGDAVVVRTGPGRALLVDTGPDPPRVLACLDGLGVQALDGVILTHFHADHISGLDAVLDRWPVPVIITTPVSEPAYGAGQVSRWAGEHGARLQSVWAGDVLRFGGVTARVWWPARRLSLGSVPNNASIVTSLSVGRLRVLLLGDVEADAGAQVAAELQEAPDAVPSGGFDVVKVAHHGSANIDPRLSTVAHGAIALVSVGADNDYGHPSARTMTRLRQDGAAVWRTDEHGSIAVLDVLGDQPGLAVAAQR